MRKMGADLQEDFWPVADNLDVAIYVANLKTSELLFLNKYAKERWGTDYKTRRCSEFLQSGSPDSCPFCDDKNLVDTDGNPTGVYRWEFNDPVTDEWFECRDEAIRWPDGRLFHLEVAVDITSRKSNRSDPALKKHSITRQT
ncbi:MAG: hypothetical protein U9Q81_21700 [Pseudomonadota bacterium]|nr:hypothetical protein [Pseudomonadota bacterium]